MTKSVPAFTTLSDSAAAGRHLGEQIRAGLPGVTPDAVVVFASARFDPPAFLAALRDASGARLIVGASSAGEFTAADRGEGTACALALHAPDLVFSAGLGRHVGRDRVAACRDIVSAFQAGDRPEYPFRAALVLTDALAGHADDLVEQLTLATGGGHAFAGGGAGDDARFARTEVFFGAESHTDACVALEVLSKRPIGVGVGHGWTPAGDGLRVTGADGARILSIDGLPAVDAFEAHAEGTGQTFDRAAPLPFFLHNILGIDTLDGHRLRVPLSVGDDGSVACAAEIPVGARVHIMRTSDASACDAASSAARSAVQGLEGGEPGAALFFDCVATRLRMGESFGFELAGVARALGGAHLVGCNTYGQIARAEGQFSGFHNCTAVVLVLPA